MQALHKLIHSLAKEEKRLYHLHRKKGRHVAIYEGYLNSPEYSRDLDRDIYATQFATLSKAFYSMQKNALLDDILAVLLEYSNSSRPEFRLLKLRSKYEVLIQKGFPSLATDFVRDALHAARESGDLTGVLRTLEDLRNALAGSPDVRWEEYNHVCSEIQAVMQQMERGAVLEEEKRRFFVLLAQKTDASEEAETFRSMAMEILTRMKEQAAASGSPADAMKAFDCEYQYSRRFEDRVQLHRRLADMEKRMSKEQFPAEERLRVMYLLMESAFECGDFLLINGLIYKIQREADNASVSRSEYLPRFMELSTMYHFYENDLQIAQGEITSMLRMTGTVPSDRIRYFRHKTGILIASNLPRAAAETLEEMLTQFPSEKNSPSVRLMQTVIAVEMNDRDKAAAIVQKLRNQVRREMRIHGDKTFYDFLDVMLRYIRRKPVASREVLSIGYNWQELFRPDLWLKAKIDNTFYYNNIIAFWQSRKKVLATA